MKKNIKNIGLILTGCSLLVLSGCSNQNKNETIETTLVKDDSKNNVENLSENIQDFESLTKTAEEETEKDKETTENKKSKKDKKNKDETTIKVNDDTKKDFNYEDYAEFQLKNPEKGETIASINIKDYGVVKVKFFNKAAPKAVENFITHAKNGYYNGLTWHRVVNDYIVQSGDPNGDSTGGESIWGLPFENECVQELVPYKGALCMANKDRANTNTSQFFVVTAKTNAEISTELKKSNYPLSLINMYNQYGGTPWLYQSYTVFGQVYEGIDILEKIQKQSVNENFKPLNDIIITSIDITEKTE